LIEPRCVSGEKSDEEEVDDSLLRDEKAVVGGEEKRGRVIAGHGP